MALMTPIGQSQLPPKFFFFSKRRNTSIRSIEIHGLASVVHRQPKSPDALNAHVRLNNFMVRRTIEPDHGYLELECTPAGADILTWKLLVSSIMRRFGGIQGAAIPVDIVTHDEDQGTAVVRCPGTDLDFVRASLNGEVDGRSVRVRRAASFLPSLA